jgi:hypothetical protein
MFTPPGAPSWLSMQASRPACKASLPDKYIVPVPHTVHSTAEVSTTAAQALFQFAPRCKHMRMTMRITSSLPTSGGTLNTSGMSGGTLNTWRSGDDGWAVAERSLVRF